ncbi:MAG: hypothetical protein Q8O56_00240 [Solirubrobacteraceae bacterium]|nr:hypothetical protein [Solirubrobacteraceae bacterium]
MAQALSLCVMSPGPPERTRALLRLCRDAVDEIVLVVDAAGDHATIEACADVVDQCHLVDCSSIITALGWMLHRCRGDWILRLDDDEVPSADLLAALPALIAERFPTNIALRRRWLYPDAGTYVATRPWLPDHQVRLIRNVPGIWSFPDHGHGALEVLGERQFRPEAIYHADALLRDVATRRAKRARMGALQPDLMAGDLPVNDLYVPEEHDVELAPVPADDAALIARVLRPVASPPGANALQRARARVPARSRHPVPAVVAGDDLARLTRSRAVLAGAYAARLRIDEPLGRLVAGRVRELEVVVENLGDEWWTPGDQPPWIRLGWRWLDPATGAVSAPEDRALFTETVLPGRATRVIARLVAPAAPGRHVLELDVVHEHVRWFGCAARTELEVLSGDP